MNKREHLKELREWATEREQAERDRRTMVVVCAACGYVKAAVQTQRVVGYSHGIGSACASVLYPSVAL